jgi:hypothetical protein
MKTLTNRRPFAVSGITAEIWRTGGIADSLRYAGIKALRYPGGQETSFFHWRSPGVNGYEDFWDDPKVWGNPFGRGRFQATYWYLDNEPWNAEANITMSFSLFAAELAEIRPARGSNQ